MTWYATLSVSVVVAVVTAVVGYWLTGRRARRERLEALRFESFRDVVVNAQKFQRHMEMTSRSELAGELSPDEYDRPRMDAAFDAIERVQDSLAVLLIVADSSSFEKIDVAFVEWRQALSDIDTDNPEDPSYTDACSIMQHKLKAFQDVLVEEARQAIVK